MIATAERGAWLDRALRSVMREAGARVFARVFVVLNGRPDAETQRVRSAWEAFGSASPVAVDWIELDVPIYPGAARNQALPRVSTEWILFLDDDAYLPEGAGRRIAATLAAAMRDVDLIGGPNLTPPGSSSFQTDAGRALGTLWGSWISRRRFAPLPVSTGDEAVSDHDLMLCNLLVRNGTILRRCGGFDSSLVCAEENDLIRRMIAAGANARYDIRFWVFHERRDGWRRFCRQVFVYARGRVQALQRSPGGLHLAHVLPSIAVAYGLAWVLSPSLRSSFSAALPALLYLLLNTAFAIRCSSFRSFFLFPAIHASYGLGFLWEGGRALVGTINRVSARGRTRELPNPRL